MNETAYTLLNGTAKHARRDCPAIRLRASIAKPFSSEPALRPCERCAPDEWFQEWERWMSEHNPRWIQAAADRARLLGETAQ